MRNPHLSTIHKYPVKWVTDGGPVGGVLRTCMCDTWRDVRGCSILWKTAAWKMKTKGRKFEKPRRKGKGKEKRKKKKKEAASVFTLVGPYWPLYSSLHSTGLRLPFTLTPVYLLAIFWLFVSRSFDYFKRST